MIHIRLRYVIMILVLILACIVVVHLWPTPPPPIILGNRETPKPYLSTLFKENEKQLAYRNNELTDGKIFYFRESEIPKKYR